MLYKQTHLVGELRDSHPDLMQTMLALDSQCAEWGIGQPTITDCHRTQAKLVELYTAKFVAEGSSRATAEKRARARRSWHCCRCAVDFRNHAWTPDERAMVEAWLRNRCDRTRYEVLFHNVASGLHFHLGRKDETWRKRFEAA